MQTPAVPKFPMDASALRSAPGARFCAWQERALHGLGVSLLARRPRELASDCCKRRQPTQAALAYKAGSMQSEEGRNVYIGIGTVLAIILIIVLLVWIF